MEKYYQPEIADLHIGYKCKIQNNGHYEEIVLAGLNTSEWTLQTKKCDYYFQIEYIRTKYLEKEDIINEGWEIKCNFVQYYNQYKESEFYCFEKGEYEIRWWGDPDYIEIYDNPKEWSCIYQGKCKSVNEFKQIVKLLGI